MQKQQTIREGEKVRWYGLTCIVSLVVWKQWCSEYELRLEVNGRTYYDYACNVEKVDE